MHKTAKKLIGMTLLAVAAGAPLMAQAAPRDEINARLLNIDSRIDSARDNGSIGPGQAHRLHWQLHTVRHNERVFLMKGYLTPGEFHMLNHQLDNVSQNVHVFRHNNAIRSGFSGRHDLD